MHSGSRLIERYIVKAILPYLLLSLLLLTAILFTQQASRFAELLVEANVPLALLAEICLALIPNVLIFALPIAMLAGTIIGFSRMGSDSELVAMRAAGVGTWNMLWPVLLLGIFLSSLTLYLNLEESPRASHALKRAVLRAALYKLDSPVEPRSFNTDIPGYVVYVRDGDKTQGQWGRVFIYSQEQDGATRLITARSGRIDSAAEQSELVLSDAVATKLPRKKAEGENAYVIERLAQLRIRFNTGRAALLARLRRDEKEPEEMNWRALSEYARAGGGPEGRDAATLRQKRLTLSVASFVFALLGAGLGLRVRKGGRGLGLLLSLLALIAYYLVSLLGEQMARAGTMPLLPGTWLATGLATLFGFTLLAIGHRSLRGELKSLRQRGRGLTVSLSANSAARRSAVWIKRTRLLSFPGLLDLGVLKTLTLSFLFAFSALTIIFLIFTLFELWRFIAISGTGVRLIMKYLFYLLPLVSVQLLPITVLLSVLATYAIMSRRSEAVAWWACGQSTYRLIFPGLLFALTVGLSVWLIQEHLMPAANVRQDALRAQIRGGVSRTTTKGGRQWLAAPETGRIYAYEYDEEKGSLKEPAIYEFDSEGVHLRQVLFGQMGEWASLNQLNIKDSASIEFEPTKIVENDNAQAEVRGAEPPEVFKPTVDKPSQLSAEGLSAYIKQVKRRGGMTASFTVALQRKYAEPFNALVLALIGIPMAFSFGRRSALAAICSAIGVGLAFWSVSGGFQQLGSYGLLPPGVAAWSPQVIFAATGSYLLSRVRT